MSVTRSPAKRVDSTTAPSAAAPGSFQRSSRGGVSPLDRCGSPVETAGRAPNLLQWLHYATSRETRVRVPPIRVPKCRTRSPPHGGKGLIETLQGPKIERRPALETTSGAEPEAFGAFRKSANPFPARRTIQTGGVFSMPDEG